MKSAILLEKNMVIEIHSPNLKVSERILNNIEKKAMKLSRFGENISRAQIFLSEENSPTKENKNCKIRLTIFGDTLFAHKTSESFETSALSAIRILKRRLKQKFEERNVPPGEITTTVDI
jgi:putative sigma-54 modulation protein